LTPKQTDLSGATLSERYRLLARIGIGGMGAVYRALDLESETYVAIKVLTRENAPSSTLYKRFRREMHALRQVHHPNLVEIFDDGETANHRLWFCMELVEGVTLTQYVHNAPISTDEIELIVRQILYALTALHAEGLVHRDLKSGNIMVASKEGGVEVKVLDLGIVAHTNPDPNRATLTAQNTILGTPEYMAPELIRTGTIDARGDLYALGILTYQMATGTVPWHNKRAAPILHAHVNKEVPDVNIFRDAPLPANLHTTMYALLQKEPGARPQDTAEALYLLDGGQLKRRPDRQRTIFLLLLAALLVTLASIGAEALWSQL
jgi:serine/threonine protein kinase